MASFMVVESTCTHTLHKWQVQLQSTGGLMNSGEVVGEDQ